MSQLKQAVFLVLVVSSVLVAGCSRKGAWVKGTAKVETVGLASATSSGQKITYTYRYNGKEYKGEQVYNLTTAHHLERGQKIGIMVNPSSPNQSKINLLVRYSKIQGLDKSGMGYNNLDKKMSEKKARERAARSRKSPTSKP